MVFLPWQQVLAEPQLPSAVTALIKHTYSPQAIVNVVGKADFNKDGINDWILSVFPGGEDDSSGLIVVIFGHANGSFTIAATSGEFSVNDERGQDPIDINFKHDSLFLTIYGHGPVEDDDTTVQFKYRQGGFYRIGMKVTMSCHADDTDCDEDHSDGQITDTNLITGDTIVKYSSDSGRATEKYRVKPEPLLSLRQWP